MNIVDNDGVLDFSLTAISDVLKYDWAEQTLLINILKVKFWHFFEVEYPLWNCEPSLNVNETYI